MSASQLARKQRLWGTLVRKERWGLSWRGWLIICAAGALAFCLLLFGIHPFLAETKRAERPEVLVMEGWVHTYAARATAEEFKSGSYPRVFTTGGPVAGSGHYINDYNTVASVGAGLLRAEGLDGNQVVMVPTRVMGRDRTYSSALALRDWFAARNMHVRGFNVMTEGTHARRTRLLFQRAFGNGVEVGVISIVNPDYDARHWWRYSEGVREILGESIAYLYARVLFHPGPGEEKQPPAVN